MKQILQNLKTGETEVVEVPCPSCPPGHLLIRTVCSVVSQGTERMLVEFGKANWLDKARQQPDKVRMVLDKIKTDGLLPTLDAVRHKLDQPLAMGYCNMGVVMEVGAGVTGFAVGDRVASNGKHAQVVAVPKQLCAKVPDGVSDEAAAFTVLAAIALQGVRLVQPTLGEAVVVTGLGLIGLLTVQLLRAHGCRVLGIDLDPAKLELAKRFGAETVDLSRGEDPLAAASRFSRGRGVDAVVIAASTTSNEPVHQAALMCRKRGRLVLVGVVGLELSRADFYEKELTFQVSCSYGPGRYDPSYEEGGHDYPIGFVRWTEQRNFEAVLDMMADGRLDIAPLITHRFDLSCAQDAYRLLTAGGSLGIVLHYPGPDEQSNDSLQTRYVRLADRLPHAAQPRDRVTLGFVGAGNYASQILIPSFKGTSAVLKTVISAKGVSGVHAGKKHGFEETGTETHSVFADPEIDTVVIATRHESHARYVCQALRAGKHVFVEKPLAITSEELADIETVYREVNAGDAGALLLMVGFNRRFAPHVQKMKALLSSVQGPKTFVMTVNAGAIPLDHWTQDPAVGGGRIIGEACHFIDLERFLVGAPIESVQVMAQGRRGQGPTADQVTMTLRFADGSMGTIHYLSNGHKSFPKERLEVFCAGRILQLDNYRSLRGYGWPGFKRMSLWRQDKGQAACAAAFVEAVRRGQPAPIPFDELVEVTKTTFDIVAALT
ncbi:MAG: bi-domain-containing oxidoreductase [Nitrospira sp.]|nr:bi-domain-containing oxidoreductase [Nitrospira sp.]MCP9442326.1 bi-domain-containing oxidoreductase [Nitrospira sp.]